MINTTSLLHIQAKAVPVESPNSLSIVERYHNPLRRAFRMGNQEVPEIDNDAALQYAVRSINDSVGPHSTVVLQK